jgi:WD40 repeat protein
MAVRFSAALRTLRAAWRPFTRLFDALILILGLGVLPGASTIPMTIHGECFMPASLQFSPSGRELACMCMFHAVRLFDTANHRKARTFLREIQYTPGLTSLSYSPDGRLIATAEDGAP